MKLHFFPALLPLASVFPWILTAIGALSAFLFSLRRKKWVLVLAILSFFGAGLFALVSTMSRLGLSSKYSVLMPPASFAKVEKGLEAQDYRDHEVLIDHPNFTLTQKWFRFSSHGFASHPVLHDSRIFLGSMSGTFESYDLETGQLKWRIGKSHPIMAPASPARDLLVVGEGLHESNTTVLTGMQLKNEPKVVWQRLFKGHLEGQASFSQDQKYIWISSGPSGFWCLRADDGELVWHQEIGHVDSKALVMGAKIYILSQLDESQMQSRLWEIRANTGEILRQWNLPGQPWGEIQASADASKLYFSTGIGRLGEASTKEEGWFHALSLEKGLILWTQTLPGLALMKSQVVEQKERSMALLTLKAGKVLALSLSDGSRLWVHETQDQAAIQAPLELLGNLGMAYLDFRGSLVVLDWKGIELARTQMGPESFSGLRYQAPALVVVSQGSMARLDLRIKESP